MVRFCAQASLTLVMVLGVPVIAQARELASVPPAPLEPLPEATRNKKLEYLAAKEAAGNAIDARRHQRREAVLRRRVGRPPAPVLNIQNTWTDETLVVDPAAQNDVAPATFNQFLRCHYTLEPTHIDPRLLGVLKDAARKFKRTRVFIVSGYRHPKYNLMLRKKGREVAKQSQHTEGHAVDFRLAGVPTESLYHYVRSLHLGGVGLYRHSEFVHADTGPVRTWQGR